MTENRLLLIGDKLGYRNLGIYHIFNLIEQIDKLNENYPKAKDCNSKEFLIDNKPDFSGFPNCFIETSKSIPCSFIANNLETPTTVIHDGFDIKTIIKEIEKGLIEDYPYSHIGFSLYLYNYKEFLECVSNIKKINKNIITIAGNAGGCFPGTEKYVDYVCKEEGVYFLRNLLGEDTEAPYKLDLVPAKTIIEFGKVKRIEFERAILTTKLGCINNCDFCLTPLMFQNKIYMNLFTPQQVHDKMVEYREKIKKKYMLWITDPTGIVNKNWWYELFKLFEEDSNKYFINVYTTQLSLEKLDLDIINKSSLNFGEVQIGFESFSQNYSKSKGNKNIKGFIKRLHDFGIEIWGSLIFGFDHQDYNAVWDEIYKFVDLDIDTYTIQNLKISPGTTLGKKLIEEGRLLDLEPEFYFLDGFQAFKHPYFKPGFEDMLPLTYKIIDFVNRERGKIMPVPHFI